ncbi:hypothetical protein ACVWCN_01175, partial [Escherichia coli]
MSLSPARQHRLRVQAEQAAREGGSVRHASGYDLMLLQLAEDRRRQLEEVAKALKELGHPTRLFIFKHLVKAGEQGLPVGELQ